MENCILESGRKTQERQSILNAFSEGHRKLQNQNKLDLGSMLVGEFRNKVN